MGFATSPYATTPFGNLFDPPATETPPTARAARARVLGLDGDYEVADDGNLAEAADPFDEEVYLRLRTNLGSYTGDVSLGNGVATVLVATSTSPIAIRDAALRALDPMLARGKLLSVDVKPSLRTEQGTTRAEYAVTYKKSDIQR